MAEKFETKVLPREYKETINPMEILVSQDLDSCVGLALVRDFDDKRKRGLTYIAQGNISDYEGNIVRLTEKDKVRAEKILKKDLCFFLNLEEFPDKIENPESIKIYVVANRTKQEKSKSKSVKEEPIGEINPMFDFIIQWVTDKQIPPILINGNAQFRREADEQDKRTYPIMTKKIALHHEKINILYYSNTNIFLNPKSCSHIF